MHSDLIAKLEALDGPSREVDALIATAVGGYVYEKRGRDQKAWFYPVDGGWRRQLNGIFADKLPAYTASLDATVALVEQMVPGWKRSMFENFEGLWIARVTSPRRDTFSTDYMRDLTPSGSPNGAIALLIATLKALEARDG